MSTAPMIAAASAAARRRLRRTFTDAGAWSPDTAIAYAPQRRFDRRYFERLVDFGALVETPPGTYYLDRERLAADDARRRKRALAMFGGLVAVGAAIFGISQI